LAVVLALIGSSTAISLEASKKSFESSAEKEFIQQGVVLRMMNGQKVRDWSDVAAITNAKEYGQETMSAV
jgi:hypothetical protein